MLIERDSFIKSHDFVLPYQLYITPFLFQGRDISKVPIDMPHISTKMSELMSCSRLKDSKVESLDILPISFLFKKMTQKQIILFYSITTNDTSKVKWLQNKTDFNR